MSERPIVPEAVTAAIDAWVDVFYDDTGRHRSTEEAMRVAIRAADEIRGLREECRRILDPTPPHTEMRLVSDWRPVDGEQLSEQEQ